MKASEWQFDSKSPVLRYGILIIAIIFWYSFLFEPTTGKIDEMTTRIAVTKKKIEGTKAEIKRLRSIDEELKRVEQERARFMQLLIPGENPQVVASNLQDDLLKKASDAGMDVLSYRAAAGGKWNEYPLGTVSLITKSGMKGLVQFLMKVDSEGKMVRLNNLNVMVIQGPTPYTRINMDFDALCAVKAKNEAKHGVRAGKNEDNRIGNESRYH
ncbi:MAG: GspMb/PilO family protein [Dissulfurimicrobium sp.]|uniref:GspMb/PilO family protein n=1 Tax=Dissulfurimicrobium TaxID=1769732 RepID=UPI001EDBF21B|nr:GspMb/PilO family protein [Dissulfurimicrobium hydrothermale]UKL13999.1 hypothetical protein LGS26_01720 [Dissulfurimicrobium hydrothermale]